MKKIVAMLSFAAVVASLLFVSCAQKKEPDLIPAFPSKKVAEYKLVEDENGKSAYAWVYADAYKYTNAKGGGFQLSTRGAEILEYLIVPNVDWTATVVGEGHRYVELSYGFGYDKDNYTFGTTASGPKGMNTLCFTVKSQPEWLDGNKECDIALTMNGETKVIATLVVECLPEVVTGGDDNGEEPEEGGENTGDENTGDENTGGENTGGENTGGENTGGENTGGENA